jgi:transposase
MKHYCAFLDTIDAVESTASIDSPKPFDAATMSADIAAILRSKDETIALQAEQIEALRHQLKWFERQIFGQKSERFIAESNPQQLYLGQLPIPEAPPEKRKSVPAHTRRVATKDGADTAESLKFFDESRVPVRSIHLEHPDTVGKNPQQYEIIGEKISYRLIQNPGSYEILKVHRPVVKIRETQQILCAPAPAGVIQDSRADVSFIAGVLVDKFAWHIPLYRQHQRLQASGIDVSRPWLTQISQKGISLLAPIYAAQYASVLSSRVKAMDETPIRAGRSGHGKMNTGYFWPIYGELDEVCFPFHTSRSHDYVSTALGLTQAPGSVLLTDGFAAYERYVEKTGLTHAQCWAHTRRHFENALENEPAGVEQALIQIQALYAVETRIREENLSGEAKQIHRLTHSKPKIEIFFDWVDRQLERQGFTPTHPFIKALVYAKDRRLGLEVFVTDPDVPIDTNHLERALRVIPMGRKSWLFCWTELGAKHVGIIQSLIVTCRLHGIDPYTYLIDVLQRVGQHPASRVAELTPRLWKTLFADKPLRSIAYRLAR